jgi:prophage maintenance system killer protein
MQIMTTYSELDTPRGELIIYTSPDGLAQTEVRLGSETVWLTQKQMVELFQTTKQNVSLHIKNCFTEGELLQESTVKEYLTVQKEGKRKIRRKVEFYNLDVIISVGYRVKSLRGTQFRIWANRILKEYLVKGYALNQKRLREQQQQLQELKQSIRLVERSLLEDTGKPSDAKDTLRILSEFAKGLELLDDYDHVSLSSVRQIYQSFNGQDLYPSVEHKAAMLLYFVVENHSIVDGNKRIAAALFLYFLGKNKILFNESGDRIIGDDGLAALTLLVAVSKPEEKETMIHIVLTILNRNQ